MKRSSFQLWRLLIAVAGLSCGLRSVLGATSERNAPLIWNLTNNPSALCNDFTRAGFFHRNATAQAAGKWVIFLESGSFCYSNATCNRRYFQSQVRNRYSKDTTANARFGDFDTKTAWDQSGAADAARRRDDGPLTKVVSPLMTSMSCFRNNTQYFKDGFTLAGKDIFDRDAESSVFREHGHVVVPYCSSDVWLGSETADSRNFPQKKSVPGEPCDCWDSSCFEYDPTFSGLQFTFRGKTIFQSVLQTLDEIYNLRGASEIILVGSSAGGLGVINLAKWVRDEYPEPTAVKVIADSAWFINFHDGINQQFSALLGNRTDDKDEGKTSISPSDSPSLETSSIPLANPTSSYLDRQTFSAPATSLTPSATISHPTTTNIVAPTPLSEDMDSSGSGSGMQEFKRDASLEDLVNQMAEERDRRESESDNDNDLLSLLESHEACYDTRRGYPCCLSAECILTESSPSTLQPYFPRDVPLFTITSLYDVFILGQALLEIGSLESAFKNFGVSLALEYLTIIGEYGGAMSDSMAEVKSAGKVDFSYYTSQCFQHIYLATSSLWGEGALFGTDLIVIDPKIGSFSHTIQSGIWNTSELAYMTGTNESYTIMEAIQRWYWNGTATFRDTCTGPYCNNNCPGVFKLNKLDMKSWSTPVRLAIIVVVMSIAVFSFLLKGYFYVWLRLLERKQATYLRSVTMQEEDEEMLPGYVEEGLKREFPFCNDDQAISVACLDLHYSVTTRVGKQLKDEKKDNFAPIVLSDLSPEDELNGSEEGDVQEEEQECDDLLQDNRHSKRLSTDMGTFQRIKHALTPHVTGTYKVPTFRAENETLEASMHRVANGNTRHNNSTTTPLVSQGRISRESNASQDTYEEVPLDRSRTRDVCSGMVKRMFRTKRKKILKGISVYFNPGEMIGIMGPSGCGKTTFLDILTGRRKSGNFSGQIFINGLPLEENRNWYVSNTGYVIQLARPYYEELTVRENLTLAAWIRLKDTTREKFQRVEQVMDVTGLLDLAETIVGGETGPGLSGGQKRRLAVALQLLKLPSVIFLDEPTSGLDAASSRELLAHLNDLAASNRTVVLTIHQPRLEIFHMFHRLVLLSDGKVAYHGVPDKAYEVFVNALRSRYLQQRLVIPDLEDRNPADVIMDMLGNQKMRQLITDYYQSTDEPRLVSRAVLKARTKERLLSIDMMDGSEAILPSMWDKLKFIVSGYRQAENTQNTFLARFAALEARATKRATLFVMVYLPIIFFGYGFLLGTVYFQQTVPFLIMSGFCVYSVASALFMFPALYSYYVKALEIYTFEHADSAGRAYDLVLQPFVRFITMAIIPVILCAFVLYVLLVEYTRWSWTVFIQVVVVNVALNQAWVALLIWLILSFPRIAIRLSPPLASVMGFTSGFFIPISKIPWMYRWLTYINPNYYGFSASAVLLLSDFESGCEKDGGSVLECYPQSGEYILNQFNFKDVNPYYNIIILLGMTLFYLLLSVLSNWWNHITLQRGMKKVQLIARKLRRVASIDTNSVFSTSIGYEYDSAGSDDGMSMMDELEDRECFLESNEPENEGVVPSYNPLSPIAEKQEEPGESEEDDEREHEFEDLEKAEHYMGSNTWEHPARFPQKQKNPKTFIFPGSLPEIPSAVSPYPRDTPELLTPHSNAKAKWKRAAELSLDRNDDIELDNFAAKSEPHTPQEKHVAFNEVHARPSRINSSGDVKGRQGRRKKSVRSVYLRDGEIHSVWKPSRQNSLTKPTTPSPTPQSLAEVVQAVMKQKHDLRERQRKLFSRVTATQAVLKEQNEELATVEEATDDEDEEQTEEGRASDEARTDTPRKKMWQQAIKTVIDDNKDDQKEHRKKSRRDRKRSTVHFHEVVTSKLASMDSTGSRGYQSVSDQSGVSPAPTSPQKVKRNPSVSRSKRQGATTPGGAIPFTEWKSQYYQKQLLTRQEAMKHFRSDYGMKPPPFEQYNLPRISSENNVNFPSGHRRSSEPCVEELEPRSKSVSQFHNVRRRTSSPDILDYDDHADMSDASVALDDMFSPLSSRSVSPSVFSDEEERRSKMHSRTPVQSEGKDLKTKSHPALMKLDSVETRILSNPSNLKKRQRRNHLQQMHQTTTNNSDDIIEVDTMPAQPHAYPTSPYESHGPKVTQPKQRPKHVSISLPTSPRSTPAPSSQPTSPGHSKAPKLSVSREASPGTTLHGSQQRDKLVFTPDDMNTRISQEQSRRESLQHLALLPEQYREQSMSPEDRTRRSSTPNILNPSSSVGSLPKSRRISTPTPPPYVPLLETNSHQPTRGQGQRRHKRQPGSGELPYTRV